MASLRLDRGDEAGKLINYESYFPIQWIDRVSVGTCLETILPFDSFSLSFCPGTHKLSFSILLSVTAREKEYNVARGERGERREVNWKIINFHGKYNLTGCCMQRYILTPLIVWLFNCTWLVTIISTDKLEWSIFRYMHAVARKHHRNSADVWMHALRFLWCVECASIFVTSAGGRRRYGLLTFTMWRRALMEIWFCFPVTEVERSVSTTAPGAAGAAAGGSRGLSPSPAPSSPSTPVVTSSPSTSSVSSSPSPSTSASALVAGLDKSVLQVSPLTYTRAWSCQDNSII